MINLVLSIGILIFSGYILGELAEKFKLPKISGYIMAGLLLNPDCCGFLNASFVEQTSPLLSISLSFITFSIGGSLSTRKLKASGGKVLLITLFESLFAFVFVFGLMFVALYYFIPLFNSVYVIIAISLVLASLAAPTDPSATLAVIHEYKARGKVSSSMLEIAAFDDIIGIIIYTLVTAFAVFLLGKGNLALSNTVLELGRDIGGAILIGIFAGWIFNLIVRIFKKQSEGSLIVLTFGLILVSYGIAEFFKFESLLATISLGAAVANFNPLSKEIFKLLERYTDELIFVVFFTLSGLNLELSAISGSFILIGIYILARMLGKFSGVYSGALITRSDREIRKYTAGGLLPQGGIVIGLALLLAGDPVFKDYASLIMSVVIGAALIHEIIGPISSRIALKKAGELE